MNQTIVIYHGGCRDGFCSAWVYNKYYQDNNAHMVAGFHPDNIEYFPGYYGQEPPDVKGKNIVILDFCYPLEVMLNILEQCNKLIWLDHHKTAQPVADKFSEILDNYYQFHEKLDFEFDNNKSGAGLTWDYFIATEPRTWLVDYVEDRDLWTKKLPSSEEVNAFISCLEFNFSIWDTESQLSIHQAIKNGEIAMMKTEQYVKEVCKNVYFVDIKNPHHFNQGGHLSHTEEWQDIPVINICQVDCSEVLHQLCKNHDGRPFSLYWFKRADGMYQYGLRSIGDFDVSLVAKLFGGGGHKNAAGFQLNYLLEELK